MVILRQYRPGDSAGVEDLWQRNPSAEFGLMGLNPGQVRSLLARTERWGIRFVLAVARVLRRPLFDFLILDEGDKVVGTTMVSFAPHSGYISGVTVDAAFRRKGHAQELLRTCEEIARKYRRRYLVLDVLSENEAAIRLYEKLGYRTLRGIRWMARDLTQPLRAAVPGQSFTILPFRPAMRKPLVRLANDGIPSNYRSLVSVRPQDLQPSGLARRIGKADSSAWVVQRNHEIVGFARATVSPVIQAAQIGPLIFAGEAETEAWTGLIDTALAWCVSRQVPRVLLSLPEHLDKALPVLQAEGFAEVFHVNTMALDMEPKSSVAGHPAA